jgi:hypothetical protein
MKANITLGKQPGNAAIVLDGYDVAKCTGAMRLTRMDGAVELVASVGTMPTLELTLVLESVTVSADGDLLVNAEPVSDNIGKAIYKSLKERYDSGV